MEIYFDMATFDDIEREKKIKVDAQLSFIGGTMGLPKGFSIISGIQVIFFLFRLILTIIPNSRVLSAMLGYLLFLHASHFSQDHKTFVSETKIKLK